MPFPSSVGTRPITRLQLAVLREIRLFYDSTGVCLSYRELAERVGVGSAAAVLAKIVVLERLGLVTRNPIRRSRNVLVTPAGKSLLDGRAEVSSECKPSEVEHVQTSD